MAQSALPCLFPMNVYTADNPAASSEVSSWCSFSLSTPGFEVSNCRTCVASNSPVRVNSQSCGLTRLFKSISALSSAAQNAVLAAISLSSTGDLTPGRPPPPPFKGPVKPSFKGVFKDFPSSPNPRGCWESFKGHPSSEALKGEPSRLYRRAFSIIELFFSFSFFERFFFSFLFFSFWSPVPLSFLFSSFLVGCAFVPVVEWEPKGVGRAQT